MPNFQNLVKAILLDAGGVLYLNKDGNGYLNAPLVNFVKTHQGKYRFGVISDTKYDLKKILEDDGISDLFSLVLTSEDTGREKTDPKIYNEAIEQLGVKAQYALLIDNEKDFIDAAKKAGLKTILFTEITDCLEKLKIYEN